jgi:hypothetical protein
MVSNILYTDIKKHFSLLKDFENATIIKPENMDHILEGVGDIFPPKDVVVETPIFGKFYYINI